MLKKGAGKLLIPFRGLKEGTHLFEFSVNDMFFDAYAEYTEIHQGKIKIDVSVIREARTATMEFHLTGSVRIPCDRCLELYDQKIDFREQLVIKYGHVHEEQGPGIIIIPEDDGVLDVSQYIYEFAHLALPIKRIHPDDADGKSTCSRIMLEKLEEYNPHGGHEESDPRWSALKDLKNFN